MREARSVKFCEENKGSELLSMQLNNNNYEDFYPIQVYKENKTVKSNQENIGIILDDPINKTNDENLVNIDLNREENTENFNTNQEVEEENLPYQDESQFTNRGRKNGETKEILEERYRRHLEEEEEKLQREGVRRSNRIKKKNRAKTVILNEVIVPEKLIKTDSYSSPKKNKLQPDGC